MEQLKFTTFELERRRPVSGVALTSAEEFVAGLLLRSDSAHTLQIRDIIRQSGREMEKPLSERAVKAVIRRLRKSHKFPILSAKHPPYGYWWCGSVAEMRDFIQEWKSQALDELHTLSQVVKHNFPALAGQLRLPEME